MLERSSGILVKSFYRPVDFAAKIKLLGRCWDGCDSLRCEEKTEYPLPPPIRGIIRLARNSRQNPHDKELRGQNLDKKGLMARRVALEQTVTASTMIADLIWGGKVRCHSQAVEKNTYG